MAIKKAKQKEYHARVPNETARDKGLSLEAKGLLCVLLSMDEDWVIYKKQIADFSKNKYHSTNTAFNELIENGYIIDEGRKRDEKGLLKENSYLVLAEKQHSIKKEPIIDYPNHENQDYDNQHLSNTITSNSKNIEKENLKEYPEPTVQGIQSELFIDDKPVSLYSFCVDVWLKKIHPGWTFSSIHGQKIKSIISKLKQVSKNSGFMDDDKTVSDLFVKMMVNIPEYYKDKDLQVIDSKFNEIITEIKKGKNGKRSNYDSIKSNLERIANGVG